ncbi:hypothetical protein SAMN04488498_113109 [Mesorhizobium albiziae]|uniref:Uncharacterized protein n=1 Tax=Neomesorhizobium albiziae TaxID=335020 RepID=A0A1I4CM87_9HYPH|nr:hypothetical protein SAMN04488498_113109 [Mesorhizobium albiziae]
MATNRANLKLSTTESEDCLFPIGGERMTGYEKYSGPKSGRWTIAIWLIAVIAGTATVYFLFA